jgi:DNA-binding Xre family transcriptional regulator
MVNNLQILVAQKGNQERRRLTLKEVSRSAGVSYNTLLLMSKQDLREYPADVVQRLCHYFQCDISELLALVEE